MAKDEAAVNTADRRDTAPAAQPSANGAAANSAVVDDAPVPGWDARSDLPDLSHYPLAATLTGHEGAVVAVRFQRDGSLVGSVSADSTARVWDVSTERMVQKLEGHKGGVNDLSWAWNTNIVATGGDDCEGRVWDVRAGQCVRRLKGHTSYVTSCSFSAAGDVLATASFDETIRLWCMHTGKLIRSIPAHSDPILCVEFSADLSRPLLVSASHDGICRLWSSHTGECGRSIIPPGEDNHPTSVPVTFATFTPNNKFLLLGTLAAKLQLWDYEPKVSPTTGELIPTSVKKTYQGHKNSRFPLQARFMVNEPTGQKYVISGSEDHHVFTWDLNKRTITGLLRGRAGPNKPGDGHCDVVHSVDSSAAEAMIASAGGARDRTVKLWKYNGMTR